MLHSRDLILLASHFELQLADLFITALLKRPELEKHIFVVFGLVSQVTLQFSYARILLILALSQIVDLPFVDVSEVLLGMGQLLLLSFFQFVDFFGVGEVELRFHVVVRR